MRNIEATLLDIDGTLVESNDQHAYAWCEALQKLGYAVGYGAVRPLIGMRGEGLVALVTGLPRGALAVRELIEQQRHIFRRRYLPSLRMMPGARALLERLRGAGLIVVAMTSSVARDAQDVLAAVGLGSFVDAIASADDDALEIRGVASSVPAALRKAKTRPEHAVLIGDSPYDVDFAKQAAVEVIALRCGGFSDAVLEGARMVFDHPRALAQVLQDRSLESLLAASFERAAARTAHVEQRLQS